MPACAAFRFASTTSAFLWPNWSSSTLLNFSTGALIDAIAAPTATVFAMMGLGEKALASS